MNYRAKVQTNGLGLVMLVLGLGLVTQALGLVA